MVVINEIVKLAHINQDMSFRFDGNIDKDVRESRVFTLDGIDLIFDLIFGYRRLINPFQRHSFTL